MTCCVDGGAKESNHEPHWFRAAIAFTPSGLSAGAPGQADAGSEGGFTQALGDALGRVDSLQGEADQKVTDLLEGRGVDVHSALIAVEKADISFQLMMQVRNKMVAAYQEISRMQF